MINLNYRLISPKHFEETYSEININKDVIVRPTHLSICHADQRYYQGTRNPLIIKKKLPMALIHESIGIVVKDNTGHYQPKDRVVMIPNTPHEKDAIISENYLQSSTFKSSGTDGFMQDLIQIEENRILKLPENINLEVLSFTELISVAIHAISRFNKFSHDRKNKLGIWGDGNLSYILALILKIEYPSAKIYIFGKHEEKLNMFSFVEKCYLINEIPLNLHIDHAFESTGGMGCEYAINQIIDYINPEGSISLLGVSENKIPINTRMVLEKGLYIFGSSRSGRNDFKKTLTYLEKYPKFASYLENIIGNVINIQSLDDVKTAFDKDINSSFGKTIMIWNK